jgi:hypothetical protein
MPKCTRTYGRALPTHTDVKLLPSSLRWRVRCSKYRLGCLDAEACFIEEERFANITR